LKCGAGEGWRNCVGNEEVLHRVKDKRNVMYVIKRRNAKRIGYILRRNCFLKHVTRGKIEERIGRKIEERIEVTGRQ
jgi:hypothetical protein